MGRTTSSADTEPEKEGQQLENCEVNVRGARTPRVNPETLGLSLYTNKSPRLQKAGGFVVRSTGQTHKC